MLTIEAIKFDDNMILSGGKFILVELSPAYRMDETVEGMDEIRKGTIAIVALTNHKLEKIEVFIEAELACSSFNELDLAEVSFVDFEGYFHLQEGTSDYIFSSKASQLKLIL